MNLPFAVVKTETLRWSECYDFVTVKCLVLNGTFSSLLFSPLLSKIQETSTEPTVERSYPEGGKEHSETLFSGYNITVVITKTQQLQPPAQCLHSSEI